MKQIKVKFYRVFIFLALVAVVFPVFAWAVPANAGTLLSDVKFSVKISAGDQVGYTSSSSGVYTLSLELSSPGKLEVGTKIDLGPRQESLTISSFGVGLLRTDKQSTLCAANGSLENCNFPYALPLNKQTLESSNPATALVSFTKEIQEKIGIADGGINLVKAVPYISFTNGSLTAFTSQAGFFESQAQGRVLDATTDNCFAPKLTVSPTSGVQKSTVLNFSVQIQAPDKSRTDCGEVYGILNATNPFGYVDIFYLRVYYGNGLVVEDINVINQTMKPGDLYTRTFTKQADGIPSLSKTTNFYALLEQRDSSNGAAKKQFTSPLVPVGIDFASDQDASGADCVTAQLAIIPTTITSPSTNLDIHYKVNNNCPGSLGPQVGILYNKDQLLRGVVDPGYLTAGSQIDKTISWNAAGLQGLTGTTNFYLIVRYTDPRTSQQVTVKSNVVPVSVTMDGVTPGDGGSGTGGGVVLPDGSKPNLVDCKAGLTQADCGGYSLLGSIETGILTVVNNLFGTVVALINEAINFIFAYFVGPFIEAVLAIRTYTDQFANVIYPAWEVMRNLGNIVFIMAIIAIGLATVFRVSGWQAKDTLLKLILGALLINFSLTMGQTVLGVADTIQNQFLPPNTGAIRLLGKQLMVHESVSAAFSKIYAEQPTRYGTFGHTVRIVASLMVSIVAFIAFLSVAVFLLIRLVALWLLLMVSPLAYVALALPATRSFFTRWWSNFIKYAFMGAAMGFMLNLTALIASKNENVIQDLANGKFGQLDGYVANTMYALASNAVVLAFLFASLKAASALGAESGGIIEKVSEKGIGAFKGITSAPFKGGYLLAKAGRDLALETFHEKTGIEIRPTKWIEGYKESRKLNQEKRFDTGLAIAASRGGSFGNPVTAFQRYWSLRGMKNFVTFANRRGRKMLKEAKGMNEEAGGLNKKITALEEEKKDLLDKPESERTDEEKARIRGIDAQLAPLVEKRDDLWHKAKHLRDHAKHMINPADTFTQSKLRSSISHKKSEINTENYHELISLAEAAIHEEDSLEFVAILQKLAETYNENEIVNAFQYTRDYTDAEGNLHEAGTHFAMSPEGIRDFADLIMGEKLKLGQKMAYKFMGDVSDIAESKGHNVLMRAFGDEDGYAVYKSKEDQDIEYIAESEKSSMSKIMSSNRLYGFIEVPRDDFATSGKRDTVVTEKFMALFLRNFVKGNFEYMLSRNTITTSMLKAFAQNEEAFKEAAKGLSNKIKVEDLFTKEKVKVKKGSDGKALKGEDGEYIMAEPGDTDTVDIERQKIWGQKDYYEHIIKRIIDAGKNIDRDNYGESLDKAAKAIREANKKKKR